MNFSNYQHLPSLVNLVSSDHHLHINNYTFRCTVLSKLQILLIVSFPTRHSCKIILRSSIFIRRQHCLAYLHLKNRSPQSSSNLLQTGHTISSFIPRRATFLLTGRLLCANLHINICTLLGTLSFHIFSH